jgi:lycopene cyclase domain-containing protein
MPGVYLAALLASATGVALIDRRWRLAAWRSPGRTATAVAIGTAFFLLWDAAGITAGVFVKGDSGLLIGIDLAPHLPLEEPVFLAFLSYLALVVSAGVERALSYRRRDASAPPSTEAP